MANENKDVIRIEDTKANMTTVLKEKQNGYCTDTFEIAHKFSGGTMKYYPDGTSILTAPTWTDISLSCVYTGWSTYTFQKVAAGRIGKTQFIRWYISGTSDSVAASMDFPVVGDYTSALVWSIPLVVPVYACNDTTYAIGLCALGSSSLVFYKDATFASSWSIGTTKTVSGEITYELV